MFISWIWLLDDADVLFPTAFPFALSVHLDSQILALTEAHIVKQKKKTIKATIDNLQARI